ncbi:hypothetical protein [Olsenella sp. DNF00959]|uniref:hypothetical protein n=1 Tax=Olsenella sp. DNF00959 TaxID=1476999 RepID=UPI00078652B3|nr:hypothetical protein [Olsenella sp. DNF00959]KXB62754.1 hypothetical protein HMPREF1868_01025 [Olsenella sp. DNF00959]
MAVNKDAAKKILDLVPEEYVKRIPAFVRAHATGKTIEKIAAEHPELYAIAEQDGPLTGEAKEQLSAIVNGIFEQKMAKHNL